MLGKQVYGEGRGADFVKMSFLKALHWGEKQPGRTGLQHSGNISAKINSRLCFPKKIKAYCDLVN